MAQKPLIDGIQILRGLAALLVVIRHGTKEINQFNFEVGQFGVDLFFVISGFVIYLTSKNINWSLFAKKRLVRILPLYWLVSGIALLGAVLLNKAEISELLTHFVFSLLFIPHGDLFPTLYVGWTLNFEMWFYILFGSLIFFKAELLKGTTVSLLTAVCIGLIIFSLQSWEVTAPTVPLLPITLEFLAGVWIAHFYSSSFHLDRGACLGLLAAAVVWLFIAPAAGAYTIWRPLAWGVPSVFIVLAFLGFEKRVAFRNMATLMLVGNASYAIYLIHPLIIRALVIVNEKVFEGFLGNWGLLLVLVAASLIGGTIFHLIIEKPLTNYFNKLVLKKT